MRTDDEQDLRRLFNELRRAEEAWVPHFQQVLNGARTREALRRRSPVLRFAALAACLSAATVVFVLVRRPAPGPIRAATQENPSDVRLEVWKSPTDFLLETPASELLHSTPRHLRASPALCIGRLPGNQERSQLMKRTAAAILLVVPLCAAAPAETSAGGDDPFGRYLFAPDKVLGHAQEVGLDESQRKSIRSEVQKVQTRFLDLQFDLQGESEKMVGALQEKPVDEAKVLVQVDRILALEKEIKKTHISLLIRIKNLLTAAQQAKMTEIQKAEGK